MKGAIHHPRRNKCLWPVLAFLREQGASSVKVTVKRHVHIAFIHHGHRHRFSMAGTPSVPEHAAWNAISHLKHQMERAQ